MKLLPIYPSSNVMQTVTLKLLKICAGSVGGDGKVDKFDCKVATVLSFIVQ